MDDNVRYHRAGLNKVISSTFRITKYPLPSFSPDLNPIENAWHLLKSRLRKRFTQGSIGHTARMNYWRHLVSNGSGSIRILWIGL